MRILKGLALGVLALVVVLASASAVLWLSAGAPPDVPADYVTPEASEPVSDPELRAELLERLWRDQTVREDGAADLSGLGGLWAFAQQAIRMQRVDGPNQAWLKAHIAEHGFPTRAEVGPDGLRAAFLIVQHATLDPDLMRATLTPLREAVAAGDEEGDMLALMTDRVRLLDGEPQLYGSQLGATPGSGMTLSPIEDVAGVDARRAALGLPPLADYLARICDQGGPCLDVPEGIEPVPADSAEAEAISA